MRRALEISNELERDGLIGRHAIIRSVAIIYYAGPISTDDLDICFLHSHSKDEIFSMKPIYDYLKSRGFKPIEFTVLIEGVKVQLIPSIGPLSNEAVSSAKK